MKFLVLSLLVVAVAAKPQFFSQSISHHPYGAFPYGYAHGYSALPYAHNAIAPVHAASSQFHSQDELGQYSYGYAGGPSSKSESRSFDGVTRGGYSYIDANGIVQSVNYVADPVHGFRVAATNLPVGPSAIDAPALVGPAPVDDTIEVKEAKALHFAAHAEALSRSKRGAVYPAHVSPLTAHAYPYAAHAYPYAHHYPAALSTQYHAQDALGQYNYGYSDGHSSKSEVRSFDGVTRGGYSYVDANGIVQTVNYVADAAHGFRVAGTNLPVGPAPVAPVHHVQALVGPAPVDDTPEVKAAKAEHFAAVAAARASHLYV